MRPAPFSFSKSMNLSDEIKCRRNADVGVKLPQILDDKSNQDDKPVAVRKDVKTKPTFTQFFKT